jgi:hypothetical protein
MPQAEGQVKPAASVKQQPPSQTNQTSMPPSSGNGTDQQTAGSWLPKQLPMSWSAAGLSMGDALEAERTAVAFSDREMSLDFRSVGTRAHHAGTFTAAVFVLTLHAQARFAQNDVRASNDVLFDRVQQEQLIQAVVNPRPRLIAFMASSQQEFAWVNVSFQLWQSKRDGAGKQTEGFEVDPGTHQPRVHQMAVLLLRVPQHLQGANPALGGTGWLVSNYALDLPSGTNLDSVQPA